MIDIIPTESSHTMRRVKQFEDNSVYGTYILYYNTTYQRELFLKYLATIYMYKVFRVYYANYYKVKFTNKATDVSIKLYAIVFYRKIVTNVFKTYNVLIIVQKLII